MSQYEENVWEKVAEDDPRRCQGVTSKGQCINKSVDGSQYCPAHGGNSNRDQKNRIKVKQYLLNKFNARAADLCDGNDIKSLRGEIGILRMLLETRLNSCKTEIELAVQSPALSDLIMKIQKLVSGCHRLEEALGKVMDESQLMSIADMIVRILSEYVEDESTLKEISNRIGLEIAQIAVKEDD